MRNWVIWIHLLHSFPAGLLLLLRLTYLSSSCSCQDCGASYMPAALASYARLLYAPGCLEGPDQGQSCAAAGRECACKQQGAASAHCLLGTARGGTGRTCTMSCSVFMAEGNSQLGVPAWCPLSFVSSVLCPSPFSPSSATCFCGNPLCSFNPDNSARNSLSCLDCFSPS